ncbi:MAG: AMP-binding protein [Acidimicrobiales bacterium]
MSEPQSRESAAETGMVPAWWARSTPRAPAVISSSAAVSFAELNGRANQIARALRHRGLEAGDAVAILCGNQIEFAETAFATSRAGLRMTPVNRYLTGAEVAYILADCDAKALVADGSSVEVASTALAGAPGCGVRLLVGGGRSQPASEHAWEDYAAARGAEDPSNLDDPVLGTTMFYTSGTTGRPKGVLRPAAAAASLLGANIYGYREDGGDVHLCTGPLHHAAPLAFSLAAPITYGASVVLMERFDATSALALIEEHGVTHTHMVPTMFHRLLSLPAETRARYDVSSLRYVLHGAAPCPLSVKQRIIEWLGPIVWEYYAASEGIGSFVDSATWLAHPGTVGKPYTPGQMIVGDEDATELAANETGLIWLRAPQGARFEYYKDPEKTSSSYRGEYFTLGDVGRVDEEGYFYLTDRSANLIISGGVNIYPAEVDAVLLQHPAVADAATIGVPDPEWGESVLAVVELQAPAEASDELAAELISLCRSRLAHFKCPRSVDFVAELPRQDNGKIYKRLLRDRYRHLAG